MQGVKRAAKYIPRFNPDVEVLAIERRKDGTWVAVYRWHGKITTSLMREDSNGCLYFNAAKEQILYQDLRKVG